MNEEDVRRVVREELARQRAAEPRFGEHSQVIDVVLSADGKTKYLRVKGHQAPALATGEQDLGARETLVSLQAPEARVSNGDAPAVGLADRAA